MLCRILRNSVRKLSTSLTAWSNLYVQFYNYTSDKSHITSYIVKDFLYICTPKQIWLYNEYTDHNTLLVGRSDAVIFQSYEK
jgi:hypothetical protein